MGFEGKNFAVVGGSSGIGRETAAQLVASKSNVYSLSRSKSDVSGGNHGG